MRHLVSALVVVTSAISWFGCTGGGGGGSEAQVTDTSTPKVAEFRPEVQHRSFKTDALIYAGDFAAFDGPETLAEIAESRGLSYRFVSSSELSQMSVEELGDYGVILWPGGYAGRQSNSLTASARDRIRRAVNELGVGFVGFCAGAFIAVSPDTSWGFALIQAETLPYYYLEDQGIDQAMETVSFPDGTQKDLVWWGGPWVPEYPGGVIARYVKTGQPAISQAWAGNGLMVLAGPHPEAPESWRTRLGLSDSDGLDYEIAAQMIEAGLRQQPMKSF